SPADAEPARDAYAGTAPAPFPQTRPAQDPRRRRASRGKPILLPIRSSSHSGGPYSERRYGMQRLFALAAIAAAAVVVMVAPAFSASPGTNGQPSQSCLSSTAPMEPGQAASAPGSAFNEPSSTNPAGGIAGQMYAGNGQTTSTPANGAAVSQYDVAC